jgi:hypothetical protein
MNRGGVGARSLNIELQVALNSPSHKATRLAHRPRTRDRAEQSRERAILSIKIDWADDVAGTDWVAGVVGLELRNPLESKSAGVAGEFQPI